MPCLRVVIVCPFLSPGTFRWGIYFDARIRLWSASHVPHKFTAQPASPQWTPRNNTEALVHAGGNKLPFSLPVKQVIKRLQAADGVPMHRMTDIHSLLKLPAAEIA